MWLVLTLAVMKPF